MISRLTYDLYVIRELVQISLAKVDFSKFHCQTLYEITKICFFFCLKVEVLNVCVSFS